MKSIPTIQKFMTMAPHTIGAEQTIEKANQVMNEFRIRHLPVLSGGRLIGILTDRDIKLVESFKDVDPTKMTVIDAMTPEPYITSPEAALSEVCSEMVLRKYGCVLVEDNRKLVGIFTWIDALRAFDELLSTRLKN